MVESEKTYCGINDGEKMKRILKKINATSWLFIELVIITIVAWAVLDPAIVNFYYRLLPLGYDSQQLVYAETTVNGSWTIDEDGIPVDPYRMTDKRYEQMKRLFLDVEGVESVYLYSDNYGAIGFSNTAYNQCFVGNDTIYLAAVEFVPNTHFYETYGLKPLPGSPSVEELSRIEEQDNKAVLTRSGAMALFGTDDVVGRRFHVNTSLATEFTVAAVVEDFRKMMASTICSYIIRPYALNATQCHYIIRLKPGVDASRFVEEYGDEVIRKGNLGYNRISRLMTYNKWLQEQELDEGRTQEINRSMALALFFLINLILAVVGTVWLHAKRRTEECGVRRAFGATRRRMFFDLMWQNALLATAAVAVGLVIYLNYAYSGLTVEYGFEHCEKFYTTLGLDLPTDLRWPDRFWPHFLVVSVIVYLIMLVTVLIGTAIPALKITQVRITEALNH